MIALAYGIIVAVVALIVTLITAIVVDTVRRIRLTRRIDEAFQKTRRLFTWPWCLKINDDGTIENEVQDTIEDHDRCFTSNEILARIAISPLNHIEGIETIEKSLRYRKRTRAFMQLSALYEDWKECKLSMYNDYQLIF